MESAVAVVAALRKGSKTTGRLHSELHPDGAVTRDSFEDLLGAMARAGLIRLTDEVFEKDGKSIPYRKAHLLADAESVHILMKVDVPPAVGKRKGKGKKRAAAGKPKRARAIGVAAATPRQPRPPAAPNGNVETLLRNWRLREAKRLGVPAFRVFSDKALEAMATSRPDTAAGLLAIPGIGLSTVQKYGAKLYELLHEGHGK
jgi:superfamily II DNA helicase RecQ